MSNPCCSNAAKGRGALPGVQPLWLHCCRVFAIVGGATMERLPPNLGQWRGILPQQKTPCVIEVSGQPQNQGLGGNAPLGTTTLPSKFSRGTEPRNSHRPAAPARSPSIFFGSSWQSDSRPTSAGQQIHEDNHQCREHCWNNPIEA
jgi:hypothetical protein